MDESDLDEGYGSAIFSLLKERCILHRVGETDFRANARQRTLDEIAAGDVRPIQ
jgi:hypothetical protein